MPLRAGGISGGTSFDEFDSDLAALESLESLCRGGVTAEVNDISSEWSMPAAL